jgi:hypothetical protein
MTYREFYTTIINMNGMDSAMVEFAKSAIDTLDRKNSNRKSGNTKTAKEMAVWREKFIELLTINGDMTAKQIAKALTTDEVEVSTQKVSAIAKSFENNEISVYQAKDEKKNKVNFYKLSENTD